VLIASVCLHCSGSLGALIAEAHIELTDVLDVPTDPANQDDAFQKLAYFVHDLDLLSSSEFKTLPIGASTIHCTVRWSCILS
jgi:hypothetical protein